MANSGITAFLSGFLGQVNKNEDDKRKLQVAADERRAKLADNLEYYFKTNTFEHGLKKEMADYNSVIHEKQADSQMGRQMKENDHSSSNALRNSLTVHKYSDDLRKDDEERKKQRTLDILAQLQGDHSIGDIQPISSEPQATPAPAIATGIQAPQQTMAPVTQAQIAPAQALPQTTAQGPFSSLDVPALHKIRQSLEMDASNPSSAGAAKAVQDELLVRQQQQKDLDAKVITAGGNAYKDADLILKMRRQDQPLSKSVFFPLAAEVKVDSPEHMQATSDLEGLITGLAATTRDPGSRVSNLGAKALATAGIQLVQAKNILSSPQSTPEELNLAAKAATMAIKNTGLTPEMLGESESISKVITPEMMAKVEYLQKHPMAPTPKEPGFFSRMFNLGSKTKTPQVPTVVSSADYAKLASGASYRDESDTLRIKP